MKLRSIRVENFKQFDKYSLSCRDMNVLVGPNNAGKSTALDALRVCHDVLRYAYRRKPALISHEVHGVCATHYIDQSQISITISSVVKNYGDDDARLTFSHINGNILEILIHPDRPVTVYLRSDTLLVKNAAQFKDAFPLEIIVVPTLGPLETREAHVLDETVKRNENTRLAHRNFRNILIRKSEEDFGKFSALVSAAWPDVVVMLPERIGFPPLSVEMFYTEARMTREVSSSGFGFQVWMQMMLQMMRGNTDALLVLDEPDIYLHPDLQRRLIRLARQSFGQVFLATHSTEIINEVNAGDILSINRRFTSAKRITSTDGYRDIFNYIGSSENSEFARMARARRIVFFEGKDRKILRRLAQKVSGAELLEDPDTVFLQAGGFSQWRRVKEVGWTLGNVFGMNIKIAALFDRDYRSADEVSEFVADISSDDIRCHVLKRKEIENYALERDALIRLMLKKSSSNGRPLSSEDACALIDDILGGMFHNARSHIVTNSVSFKKRKNPSLDDSTVYRTVMLEFEDAWSQVDQRLSMVSGKEFVSVLSARLHDISGVSITLPQIISEMRVTEVSDELTSIIKDIEHFFS